MSHEPECVALGTTDASADECLVCRTVRKAYKRGRDQMATAITAVIFDFPESRRTLSVQRLIDDVVHALSTNYVSQPKEQANTGNNGDYL